MLRAMPGVASDDISAKLNVRGAAPRDTQVRLDGMELFEPYHLQDQDGALGVVDLESLGSMEMITGGFPADMGWPHGEHPGHADPAASGGREAHRRGLSLSSVFASSQGTFAGDRGQWLATARRGFLDIVLDITGVDDKLSPRYWDGLGRVQLLVAPDTWCPSRSSRPGTTGSGRTRRTPGRTSRATGRALRVGDVAGLVPAAPPHRDARLRRPPDPGPERARRQARRRRLHAAPGQRARRGFHDFAGSARIGRRHFPRTWC